ncbi:MAG: DUF1109 family protein [Methyloprofundus sp.]|nr:DUF1109 family protein [Methyloprofundus sp.]
MTPRNRMDLIKGLSANVPPVRPRNGISLPIILWFFSSWIYVIALSLYLGPLRGGALKALITSPQFAFESSIGFISGALFCVIAFQESIPGLRHKWLIYLSYFSAILWISCYIVGLSFPALEPSMLGKRAHCVLEAYLYSVPPLIIGYFLIYRRYPLNSLRAGIFLGISAGMLPALFMQISCMYDPRHILTHHIGPAIVAIVVGAILGIVFKKRKCLLNF